MKIRLEKGHTHLDVSIPDEKVLDTILGEDVPPMSHDAIKQIISKGIESHCPPNIHEKSIAIIIPDDTRLWARGDIFVPWIVQTLVSMGVSYGKIKIIIALGTHADMKDDQFTQLAGTECIGRVQILNSANQNQDRLVQIGTTPRGTKVTITKEAVESDHIIVFGGILHHMAAGFGGGRKYILPGIAGYESIQQNHSLLVNKDGSANSNARQAVLEGNPIHEDATDAADLFLKNKTCTYIAVAANGVGDIFYADAGPLHQVFDRGCEMVNQACCVRLPKKGDFALISAGGYRTDSQLYQSTKALFNTVNIVKDKGKIFFVAGCFEGVGNDTFSSVLINYKNDPKAIGKKLAQEFDMPSYVAFRVIDLLNRYHITLISDLPGHLTRELGFDYTDDLDKAIQDVKGEGYIIPFAENILPVPDIE